MQRSAEGDRDARSLFAATYLPVVRACLAARWSSGPMRADIDDAIQETFLEFFRDRGALDRLDTSGDRRFRTYLFAVTTNVARRYEERRRPGGDPAPADLPSNEERASKAFDRRWAQALLQRAAARQAVEAKDEPARRRVELLRLRFQEGMPIRDIAAAWRVDPAHLHREYAQAREEFKRALLAEISWHGPPGDLEAECRRILESLT